LFTGVLPALFTPFTGDDRVDVPALERLIRYVLDRGVHGLYLCGSTGEGISMTEEERRLVADVSVKTVAHQVPVIVHVGATATGACQRLAQHAEQIGADAVSAVPPFYYSVGNQGVEEHYRLIASASKLPLYIYNLPGATGVNVGADLAQKLFKDGVIAGMKFTAPDTFAFRTIIEACGPTFNIVSGPDEMLLSFLVMGGHGGIGTTYNPLPRVYAGLYAAWQAGNIKRAQELQWFIDRYVSVIFRYGVMAAAKATMEFLGAPVGQPRRPFVPITAEQKTRLRADLEAISFFEWASGEK
jgi:N-acetylneuraminate lyase